MFPWVIVSRSVYTRAALCALAITLVPLSAADAKRPQGVNVNQSQKDIDWDLVAKKSRFEFAYIRASEGLQGTDKYYDKNIKEARKAGITVGAFHRMYPRAGSRAGERDDAEAEAKVFLKSVGRVRKDDMVPVLGVDPPFDGLTGDRLIRWVQIFMDKVSRKLHVLPGIYTSQPIWVGSLDDTTYFAKKRYPLWIASRDVPKPLVPAKNWNKKGWSIWQKQIGNVQGIEGDVNKNVLTYRSVRNLTVARNRP